nr:hypothetical protein [Tanacetum cinerariifolium]
MYHNKNVDYVYLLWEDLVFQVENKNSKKNNDMDESMFTTIRVIHKHQDTQVYDAVLPQHLTNQAMLESEAYKTYRAYATGEKIPKPKYVQKRADYDTSTKKKPAQAPKGKRIKAADKVPKSGKKKLQTQGLETLSEIALSEAEQIRIATKRSKTQFHSSYASGSGADEGTGASPGVPDGDNQGDDDEDDDNEQTESDDDGDDFVHPKLSTHDEEERRGNDEEEKMDEEEELNELYRDVNVNLEGRDTEMTDTPQTNLQVAILFELELKKILIDKMETNKSIHRSYQQKTLYKALIEAYETNKVILNTYGDTITIKRHREDEDDDKEPSAGSNRGNLAQKDDSRDFFNELMDNPLDFSAFVMNRLKVDTLTPELLVGPAFELMKGSCKSLVELEYFLKEVYKATTDQLD